MTFLAKCYWFLVVGALSAQAHIQAPSAIHGQDIMTNHTVHVELSSSTLKGTVIVFLSATCPVTESHLAEIKRLTEEFSQYRFIGLHSNTDESVEEVRDYFKKASLAITLIRDKDQQAADEFKALKTPHAFLVDSTGKVLYQGGISNSEEMGRARIFYLRDALLDHSQGKAIKVPYGRTLGCVIKRGDKHVW